MRVAQSSHLQGYEYDHETATLHIQFTNGAVYAYSNVPPHEYYNFAQSSSPGTYFHDHIRGKYGDTPISPAPSNRKRKR